MRFICIESLLQADSKQYLNSLPYVIRGDLSYRMRLCLVNVEERLISGDSWLELASGWTFGWSFDLAINLEISVRDTACNR